MMRRWRAAVGEGDVGPNTGGMGAYSPAPVVTPAIEAQVMSDVIAPLVEGMSREGCPFQGVIFAGLMIDPATQRAKVSSPCACAFPSLPFPSLSLSFLSLSFSSLLFSSLSFLSFPFLSLPPCMF